MQLRKATSVLFGRMLCALRREFHGLLWLGILVSADLLVAIEPYWPRIKSVVRGFAKVFVITVLVLPPVAVLAQTGLNLYCATKLWPPQDLSVFECFIRALGYLAWKVGLDPNEQASWLGVFHAIILYAFILLLKFVVPNVYSRI